LESKGKQKAAPRAKKKILTTERLIVGIVLLAALGLVGSYVYTLGVINYAWPYPEQLRFMYNLVTGAPSPHYSLEEDETIVYLTWIDDPSQTMTVQWVSRDDTEDSLRYRETGEEEWSARQAESVHEMVGAEGKYVHWITLDDLDPDTQYEFELEEDPQTHLFRTMPDELDAEEEFKVAFAGDSREFPYWFEEITANIGEYNPHLLVGKGDYVACEGIPSSRNTAKWLYFLKTLEDSLVNEAGEIIPYVLAMGNHEVDPGYPPEEGDDPNEPEEAEYMHNLFKSPLNMPPEDVFYGSLEFGDYLQLLVMDSMHTAPVTGSQAQWLEETIDDNYEHIIPVFHSAVFPTNKDFYDEWKEDIRQMWLPSFYENGVRVVMEACDHTYKQTIPLEFASELPAGLPDEEEYLQLPDGYLYEGKDGMVFFGDGGWGVGIREVYNPATTWYLEEAIGWRLTEGIETRDGEQITAPEHTDDGKRLENVEDARHFFGVELQGEKVTVKSINYEGEVFRESIYEEQWQSEK